MLCPRARRLSGTPTHPPLRAAQAARARATFGAGANRACAGGG